MNGKIKTLRIVSVVLMALGTLAFILNGARILMVATIGYIHTGSEMYNFVLWVKDRAELLEWIFRAGLAA